MSRFACEPLALLVLTGLTLLPASAAEPLVPRDAPALAAEIDRQLAAAWQAAGVTPAERADDAEFLRRLALDLAGRIPSVPEARAFLNDRRPDARARLIDQLLADPRYAAHFTHVWRDAWLPETDIEPQFNFLIGTSFTSWLQGHLSRNTGYDVLVRELLTYPVPSRDKVNEVFNGQRTQANPLAYYLVKKFQPEELAAGAARQFLGIRLECAQCHDHPFADWKREQFWSFASFFAGLKKAGDGFPLPDKENLERRELAIPGTDRVVQASFLDGSEPRWKFKVSPRVTLAEWTTRADNPYFARATVNRLWAYFFGTGLVDPFDDMVGGSARDSHPELLDELARQFSASKFDLKHLIRAITLSRAYQLTSGGSGAAPEPHHFARMPVRGLSPLQLYDSLAQAVGLGNTTVAISPFADTPRNRLLARFSNTGDRAVDVQTSILQALTLMNGNLISDATSLERSATLAAVLDAPFFDSASRLDTLYLAALSRLPRPTERQRMLGHIDAAAAGPDDGRQQRYQQALADVFWVLLNSAEFVLNH